MLFVVITHTQLILLCVKKVSVQLFFVLLLFMSKQTIQRFPFNELIYLFEELLHTKVRFDYVFSLYFPIELVNTSLNRIRLKCRITVHWFQLNQIIKCSQKISFQYFTHRKYCESGEAFIMVNSINVQFTLARWPSLWISKSLSVYKQYVFH